MGRVACVPLQLVRVLCALLGVALASACAVSQPVSGGGRTRTYYVAADEIDWNYAPSGRS